MVAGWLLGVLEHQDRLFLLYHQESRVFHLCQGIQVHLKSRKRHTSHHHIPPRSFFFVVNLIIKGYFLSTTALRSIFLKTMLRFCYVSTFRSRATRQSWSSWSSRRSRTSNGTWVSFLTCSQSNIRDDSDKMWHKIKGEAVFIYVYWCSYRITSEISDYLILVYLVLQAHHPAQVLREVLGFQLVLESLGNLELLYLRAHLEYLILEDRGLPLVHSHQGILYQ